MSVWRKDEMPMDGTPICVRAVCTYRYQPYKPNSEQRKRGLLGRWQVLNEYGGWSNCAAPINDGWMLASDWTPEVEAAATGRDTLMAEVGEVLSAAADALEQASKIFDTRFSDSSVELNAHLSDADAALFNIAYEARALLKRMESANG